MRGILIQGESMVASFHHGEPDIMKILTLVQKGVGTVRTNLFFESHVYILRTYTLRSIVCILYILHFILLHDCCFTVLYRFLLRGFPAHLPRFTETYRNLPNITTLWWTFEWLRYCKLTATLPKFTTKYEVTIGVRAVPAKAIFQVFGIFGPKRWIFQIFLIHTEIPTW
jgi:hypothetical protein